MKKILLIEDDDGFALAVKDYFELKGVKIDVVNTGAQGLLKVEENNYKIVLLDLRLPDVSGLSILPQLFLKSGGIIIVITAFADTGVVVDAMKKGAFDFITKPCDLELLFLKLKNILEHLEWFDDELLVGNSKSIVNLKKEIKIVSKTRIPVLIVGETGTGKELVARAIHVFSGREGNFIDLNCASIPHELFESELFGYKKGAFTGAVQSKKGLFKDADNGTLFLDEIVDLPMQLQPKLLRVLETGEFRPLGATENEKVDVKLVSATNVPVEEIRKKIRSDLFYRISSYVLEVPPLRERKEDVPLLIEFFLEQLDNPSGVFRVSKQAMDALVSYDWPGNVRELKSEIERALLLCSGEEIDISHLSPKVVRNQKSIEKDEIKPLRVFEKEYVQKVLRACGGNKSKAAKLLGISRLTLRKKLKGK